MTTSPQHRVHAGVPSGGEFTAFGHSDKVPTLGAPTATEHFVINHLAEIGFTGHMSDDEIVRITAELNATRDFRDENITAVADRIHRDTAGYTVTDAVAAATGLEHLGRLGHRDEAAALGRVLAAHSARGGATPEADIFNVPGTNTRLHVLRPEPVPDGKTVPVPANDPRLRAGEVFDKVRIDRTVFTRAAVVESINDPQQMRFQANRPITDEEAYTLSGVVGYANRAAIGGEPLDDPSIGPECDTPFSFIVNIDTTKGRRRNYDEFEVMVASILRNGTAQRKSQNNTRAIEAFDDPDLSLEIYYGD
jgi:hypothetical protein